jgi:DNA-directed RNA polymerase subunit RPC12/RpoP
MRKLKLTSLIDCPACKYGTIDPVPHRDENGHRDGKEPVLWRCADCGREFTAQELKDRKIIK